jgi:malonate transporter
MAAVPTAPSAYVLATQMGGKGRPVAFLITIGTLAAALTLPAWLASIDAR